MVVCPAFPSLGRSVYQGHLFVDDRLLSESGMEHHPLTPMTDPDIRRWLSQQTRHRVGHVAMPTIISGTTAIRAAQDKETERECRYIVLDTASDADLRAIGEAAADEILISGGSGVALGLPDNFRNQGLLAGSSNDWVGQDGPCIVLSGSCSQRTREQIEHHCMKYPAREVVVDDVIKGDFGPDDASDWLMNHPAGALPLLYSSADPQTVATAQERHGRDICANALETLFADTARQCVARSATRIVTAGGETSGAIVEGLDCQSLAIGPEIALGVPAMRVSDNLVIALKSGNFGEVDFFERAAAMLEGTLRDI